jgi:hypothetical protein
MIITKSIKLKITKMNINHIISKGYDVKLKDIIEIKPEDLNCGSHIIIDVKCDVCGKEKKLAFQKYFKSIKNANFYACSSKCAQEKVKKTSIKKFGKEYYMQTDEYKDRVNLTDIEKYGCHHTQNSEVKEKQRNSIIKKYGVDNYFKSDEFKENNNKILESKGVINNFQLKEVKEKSKETCLRKYNVPFSGQCKEIRNKQKITNFKKYGFEYSSSNPIIKDKVLKTNLKKFGIKNILLLPKNKEKAIINREKSWISSIRNKYNNLNFINFDMDKKIIKIECCNNHIYDIPISIFYQRNLSKTELCTICHPIGLYSSSGYEKQLYEFIKNNYDNVITNTKKIITPLELDIYLSDLKIAFEFNGIYWHNELYKEKNYHLNKTELCEQQGIQLIHIYEDDWLYKQDIIKSMILNKLGKTENKIFARKCEIRKIDDNFLVRSFLDENHIQGFIGSKIKIGLFFNNDLVSLMTFGNLKNSNKKNNQYELLRFCNKLNTNVIGGASRLFKYFINNYNPIEITTYVDRSISQGKLYNTLGFNFVGKTESNYYYVFDGVKQHRFNFRKDKLIKEGFDINKTEHQIMLERKIYRIYDSGNLKYLFKTT